MNMYQGSALKGQELRLLSQKLVQKGFQILHKIGDITLRLQGWVMFFSNN